MTMLHALKNAIAKHQLFLSYQPIFNLPSKKMVGMEALVRWKHPEWGQISPETFIPLAEKAGLIDKIGIWVLKSVCKQAKRWHDAGCRDFTIAINISSLQLLQKNLPHFIKKILSETSLSPNCLLFEITETSVIPQFNTKDLEDLSVSEQVLKEIHDLGINISLDDFGTGHSSLIYLSRLPVQAFKIDKSFVQGALLHSKDAIIVKTLLQLGKDLNLVVTAEGIEEERHLKFLMSLDCPQGQGYLLGKPLSPLKMTHLLKNACLKEK